MSGRRVVTAAVAGDLRDRTPVELRALLGAAAGRVIRTRLFRAAVLQTARDRASGVEAFGGHVRALWHRVAEPVLARLSPEERGVEPYAAFHDELASMVFDQRLTTYSALGITDPNWEERRIGGVRPDVIVVAEKLPYFRMLRRVHEALGVTVCVTSGYPPGATCEYTARHVREASGRPDAVVCGLADFDLDGWTLLDVFCRHVQVAGLRVDGWTPLFLAADVPDSRRRFVELPLVTRGGRQQRVAEWAARTGAPARRIELEALTTLELEELVMARVQERIDATA